jgi:hypothetical protein
VKKALPVRGETAAGSDFWLKEASPVASPPAAPWTIGPTMAKSDTRNASQMGVMGQIAFMATNITVCPHLSNCL